MPFATSVVCPILIGRGAHLALLEHLADEVCAARGQCVVISGEAGIGKSRLVAELKMSLAHRSGVWEAPWILEGHCFEPDRALPFGPFIDLLRTLLAAHSPDEIARYLTASASELVKLVPELAAVVPDLAPSQALGPQDERQRLFHALDQVIHRLTAHRPLLVAIEDLHWSDEASLEFLVRLARRCITRPMLLVLTYRSDEVGPRLTHFLAELDRARVAQELPLDRLTPRQLEEMLRAMFGRERPIHAEFVHALHALSDGNPFFVEEVLRSSIISGEIRPAEKDWDLKPIDEFRIPRSVQDAVQRRLQHLSPAARGLLAVAAVAGRRFDFALLQQFTGHEERELIGLIKELIAVQLVEEAADRYAFRHSLTQQAIYASLLARERQLLHRQIAESIERLKAPALDAHLADLAFHYHRSGAWERALEFSQRAGQQAQRLFAPLAAIAHFSRALHAAEQVAGPKHATLLRSRGQVRAWVGHSAGACQDFEGALERSIATGDRDTEWQVLIDLGLFWLGQDFSEGRAYCERALEVAREIGDRASLAHCLNRVGECAMWTGQPFEARRYLDQALTVFRDLGDQRGLAETLELLGTAAALGCDLVGADAYHRQALERYRDLDDRRGVVICLLRLTGSGPALNTDFLVPATSGLAECAARGEQAVTLAREIGWRAGEAEALAWLSLCLTAKGDHERALELARTGLALAEEIDHREAMLHGHGALGNALEGLLALPTAVRRLERALALGHELRAQHYTATLGGFLASAYIEAGELRRAEALLDATLGTSSAAETFGERKAWSVRAELALAVGAPQRALELAEWLIASAPNSGPQPEQTIVRLELLRGQALAGVGRTREAEAALRRACDVARVQGARPLLWRTQAALGRLYQGQARRPEAEREFSAARSIIEELAVGVHDAELRDNFLRQADRFLPAGRGPTPRRAAKLAYGGLTEREREVAALVAQGKRNRDIAGRLVVSKRTVDAHVSSILSKLGFQSRDQIATWAAERGLTLLIWNACDMGGRLATWAAEQGFAGTVT